MQEQSFDQRTVRVSHSISLGEREYVAKRKETILDCLKNHGIHCQREEVPHIAILGSGGGLRAVIGLLGSLLQLDRENLLDCSLYLCGVSGSSWCMSSLYQDPGWAAKVPAAVKEMTNRLTNSRMKWEDVWRRLSSEAEEEDFSLTDVWAAGVVARSMREMDTRHLSEEATRGPTNPYPIYSTINKDYDKHPGKGTWFEFTPHEAGYSDLGAFVPTALLRSRFWGGQVEKEVGEMDMLRLQGVCGSLLGDPELIAKELWKMFWYWIDQFLSSEDKVDGVWPLGLETWKNGGLKDREMLLDRIRSAAGTWLVDHQDEGTPMCSFWQVMLKIFKKFGCWEWGTVSNFLHKLQNSEIPVDMQDKEKMNLIDAGLFMNSSYPPVLRQEREVDLILSLDFSEGNPFETLAKAAEYSEAMKKPFPVVDESKIKDVHSPSDFYVFEGTGSAPTVIHMPLFNIHNCKDKKDISRERAEYSTFRWEYTEGEAKHLLEKAATNIRNNKANILSEIEKAVRRRQQRN
ncbi:cytosolic phospholipase A2 gamma-like [Megalops cyprinoides]|uniref:cytosolic phospholipase A2 gamma-like n=1 Tax=Megalops cyprinoides TaxID=118141 RepID=UPI0018652222|nr:cytosolic phospholipase A2 gamma-like [Megalops cyprinoides]